MKWFTADRHLIEVVAPASHEDYPDHFLHVTRDGAEIGYFATVRDLSMAVDLRGLHEVDEENEADTATVAIAIL